jgi:hypothetical protein
MSLSRRGLLGAGLALPLVARGTAGRAPDEVDLQLVLAVDTSRSVDAVEFDLQRRGYADALTAPAVLRAIASGEHGRIAVAYVEWSGGEQQQTVAPWTAVGSRTEAGALADAILGAPRAFAGYTSISGALLHSLMLFRNCPFACERKVVDVSGDGVNNSGRSLGQVRDTVVAAGITINGLPIINDRPNPYGRVDPKLDEYYQEQVIGGEGSFSIVADSFESFGAAVLSKLIREIA